MLQVRKGNGQQQGAWLPQLSRRGTPSWAPFFYMFYMICIIVIVLLIPMMGDQVVLHLGGVQDLLPRLIVCTGQQSTVMTDSTMSVWHPTHGCIAQSLHTSRKGSMPCAAIGHFTNQMAWHPLP